MKTCISLIVSILLGYAIRAQQLSIIPQPREITLNAGNFPLHEARIILPADKKARDIVGFFIDAVK
ncbi:MAG: hypothetical protein EOO00_09920, partial [Chitinophagaceae bacterium]